MDGTKSIKTCEKCGIVIRLPPSQARRRRYCSRACDPHFNVRKLELECELCGEAFRVHPSRPSPRFCSEACRRKWFASEFRGEKSPQWRGGAIDYYGPNWKRQRRLARQRDGHQCQGCGITSLRLGRKMAVHHIVPFREFGAENYLKANALDNLISLCPTCHMTVERTDNRIENLQLRNGKHGKGVALCCGDCGSRNIVEVPLD